ncbi:hypothetical protein M3231_01480 [Neobacillus mesonae]|nr:hypothetical protein [Neobacillus mesonae]
MAICIEFELLTTQGTTAEYAFGPCLQQKSGIVVLDIPALIHDKTLMTMPIDQVVQLKNAHQSQAMANRVFGKVYKYYLEHGHYPASGGYYA